MAENPFRSSASSTPRGSSDVFRPLRAFTVVVSGAMLLSVLLLLGVAVTNVLLMSHDPDVFAGQDPRDGTSVALAVGLFLSSIGYLFVYVVAGVMFCAWLVRASKNARALGAQGMEFTPGWTAGWFFVPFLNLVRPYEAIKELYQASDPQSGATDWGAFEPPGFILTWWFSWIAFTVGGAAAQNFWNLPWLTAILGAISAILAIRVLVAIERRQLEKSAHIPFLPATEDQSASPTNRFL